MDVLFYKTLHLAGVIGLFLGLGGLAVVGRVPEAERGAARKPFVILHGVSLLILLVAGFGLLAKLGVGMPGWVHPKLLLWLFLGGITVLFKRRPERGPLWAWVAGLLGVVAAVFGVYKPFA